MSLTDTPQVETFSERFRREVGVENLDRVGDNLTLAENETGFVAWAVETAEARLWNRSGEEDPTQRADLPSVTLEDVARLHMFADDVEKRIANLQKDVQRIRKCAGDAYYGSQIADQEHAKKGGNDG